MTDLVSVVVPVYREAATLEELHRQLVTVLEAIDPPVEHEVIFVLDGATDGSDKVVRQLREKDDRVGFIELSRNFGHQVAVTAGLDHARGDAAVIIDADLQDPPQVVTEMIRAWRGGADVAYGVRTARRGESTFKRLTAAVFYRMLRRLSEQDLPVDSGDFRLVSRRIIDFLAAAREEGRYLRGLIAWAGYRQVAIPYERDPREEGSSGYTLAKLWRLATAGLVGFSERPLRIATKLGALIVAGAFALLGWIVLSTLLASNRDLPGFASIMCAVLFLGGVQLLGLGIVGEYVGQISREVRRRPLYVVDVTDLPGQLHDPGVSR